jgi:hypothetical protein
MLADSSSQLKIYASSQLRIYASSQLKTKSNKVNQQVKIQYFSFVYTTGSPINKLR